MNNHYRALIGITVLALLLLAGCGSRDPLVDRMVELEQPEFPGQELSEERIQELEREVRRYRERIDDLVHAHGQLMVYYRMLGLRYLEREMYGPAMEALENALEITPANARLHAYYAAAAAHSAKARYEAGQRDRLLQTAEQAYTRALELEPSLSNALYGLAVLQVFELDSPQDALPHLDRLIELQQHHIQGRFLRARAHAALGNIAEAVQDYDEIIDISRDREMRRRAGELRSEIQDGSL